ncbi:MAG: hypothetical protein COA54_04875 [Thiotrichaceae bacterium]|nr:MAG: hypothetical protein COA54_04875 [Thiotrichaceae bacterium]
MSHSRGVTHELRRMNRYGVLAAYIPAFDSIVGRMQYDLFHAYTVDQHILFVIRNMRRLSVPEFCGEFPLASGVFQHLPKPELLYLSGLFHDIAKGRPGDHSDVGAVDAKDFCILHGLSEDNSELVSWLVKSHLIMSFTAQRKDISDPDIISEFARHVKTIEHLDYLYLLTICDIRATNPKQWNNWKDKLLAELYNKTASLLNKGLDSENIDQHSDKEINILKIQTDSLRQLEKQGINSHQANRLWNTLNEEYFQGHTPGEIVWQTSLIHASRKNKKLGKPLIQTRVAPSGDNIELFVYMKSRTRIFYDIVTVLRNSEVDIANAQIINTSDDYALETFRLIPVNIDPSEISFAADEINNRLQERLLSENTKNSDSIPNLANAAGKNKYFSSPTIITFNNLDEDNSTRIKIETINRSGILESIAKVLINNKINLLNARIVTAGEKAIDYFIVNSNDNAALSDEQINTLKQQLKDAL